LVGISAWYASGPQIGADRVQFNSRSFAPAELVTFGN
jgi:hypothetical protein